MSDEVFKVDVKPIPFDKDREIRIAILIDPKIVRRNVGTALTDQCHEMDLLKQNVRLVVETNMAGVCGTIEMGERDGQICFGQSCGRITRHGTDDSDMGSGGFSDGTASTDLQRRA